MWRGFSDPPPACPVDDAQCTTCTSADYVPPAGSRIVYRPFEVATRIVVPRETHTAFSTTNYPAVKAQAKQRGRR